MLSAIILAAGLSSRIGQPKLLLPLKGKSVIRWTAERVLASGLGAFEEAIVVLGREAEAIERELEGLAVRTVFNPRFAEGMSTSLKAGLQAVSPTAGGAMIFLGDQPLVSPEVVRGMIATFRVAGRPIVVPLYDGVRGNPVLFAASLFPELMTTDGDKGGRDVVARSPERVTNVVFPSDLSARDVDTWEDYEALCELVSSETAVAKRGRG